MILEIRNINKSFSGKHILKDVSFSVESGKAMGFLGRNGAGKTTTIRILMEVFRQDSGEIYLDGKPFNRKSVRIGYLPEERGMYQKISIIDQLIYFAVLKGMNKKEAVKAANYYLKKLELETYANKKLETLSKGNQQKVQIIQAVIDDPDIVIFDEPFSGLDPVNSMILKDLIREFIAKGRIVVFSSHQMSYVEEFCDDVAFIKKGEIVLSGNLNKIKQELGRNNFLLQTNDILDATSFSSLENFIGLKKHPKGYIIETSGLKMNYLLTELARMNINIKAVSFYEPSLEEIFVNLDKESLNETHN